MVRENGKTKGETRTNCQMLFRRLVFATATIGHALWFISHFSFHYFISLFFLAYNRRMEISLETLSLCLLHCGDLRLDKYEWALQQTTHYFAMEKSKLLTAFIHYWNNQTQWKELIETKRQRVSWRLPECSFWLSRRLSLPLQSGEREFVLWGDTGPPIVAAG